MRTLKEIIVFLFFSTDRLVAQLKKNICENKILGYLSAGSFAILGGTVILKNYNEIINIY